MDGLTIVTLLPVPFVVEGFLSKRSSPDPEDWLLVEAVGIIEFDILPL
jgi:hypothetical protein